MKKIVWSLVTLVMVVALLFGAFGCGEEEPVVEPEEYSLKITAIGEGTTSPAPGTSTITEGESVTVTAIPNPDYQFGYWKGDVSGTTDSVTFTMTSDKSVVAVFVEEVAEPLTGSPVVFKVLAWSSSPGVMECQQPAMWDLFARIERKSGGLISFKFVGGTEVYPLFEQGEALVAGTICDVLMSAGGFIGGTAPELMACAASVGTQAEKRANGFVDLVNEALAAEDRGVFWLTELDPSGYDDWNMLFTNVPITTLDDIDGLIIVAASANQVPMVENFGGVVTLMGPGGFYTAMERGMADGYIYPILTPAWFTRGLNEVTSYIIIPGYAGSGVGCYFNLDVWEGLPQSYRDLIMETTLEIEEEWTPRWLETYERYIEQYRMAGLEVIDLSAADHAAMEEIYYDAMWKDIKAATPNWADQLRALAGS